MARDRKSPAALENTVIQTLHILRFMFEISFQ